MKTTISVDQVTSALRQAAYRGLAEGARVVEMVSANRAPIRDGFLRNSVLTTLPVQVADQMTAIVAFNIIYARYQHEGVGFNHPRGGQAKFLSQTMEDHGPVVQQIIANHLRGAL